MRADAHTSRQRIFIGLTLALVSLAIGLLIFVYFAVRASSSDEPKTLGDVAMSVSERDKEKLQAFLRQQTGGIHDTVPDGEIGRIMQAKVTKPFGGVSVTSNNAGMRDDHDYGRKASNVYRVIILGDSFAFGHEGLKEDRYGDQLAALLRRHATVGADKRIEVLNIAQGSWTSVNETAYMISRFSAYQPDLVIMLLVSNDLDDTQGVRGIGTTTNSFTPEYRDKGSSFFTIYNPTGLGFRARSLLYSDLGPESSRRWSKAFAGIKRLESTLDAAGGKLLLSVFDEYRAVPIRDSMSLWRDLNIHYAKRVGLHSPMLFVYPYLEKDTVVGSHPNRKGHGYIAVQYLHALKNLAWINVSEPAALPSVHHELDMRTSHQPDAARIDKAKGIWKRRLLRPEIDFTSLDKRASKSIYGGLFRQGKKLVASRSLMFLLKRSASGKSIEFTIHVPRRPELYPFTLEPRVNGKPLAALRLASHMEGGKQSWRVPLPADIAAGEPLEIELFTRSYWAEISNPTMLSYYPLSAKVID